VTSIATDVSNVRAEVKTQNGEVLTALAAINGKLDGKTTNTSDPKPPGGIPLNRAPRLPLAEPLLGGSTEEALETMNDDELAAALDEFIEAIIPNRSVVGTTHLSWDIHCKICGALGTSFENTKFGKYFDSLKKGQSMTIDDWWQRAKSCKFPKQWQKKFISLGMPGKLADIMARQDDGHVCVSLLAYNGDLHAIPGAGAPTRDAGITITAPAWPKA
jgi:hypothetical protein